MKKKKKSVEEVCSELLKDGTKTRRQLKKMLRAERKLYESILLSDSYDEEVSELEEAAIRTGFYAGFMAAREIQAGRVTFSRQIRSRGHS